MKEEKYPLAFPRVAVQISRFLRDVYISTGFDDGMALNISDCRNPFDTESWSNNSLSIDGGRRSKEEYKSRVSLGEHSEREKNKSEMEAK